MRAAGIVRQTILVRINQAVGGDDRAQWSGLLLGILLGLVDKLRTEVPGAFHAPLLPVDVDLIGADPVGALPDERLTFVVHFLVVIGRDHAVGRRLHGLILGEHGGGSALAVRHARALDMALGLHVAALLVHDNLVRGSGSGGIPEARAVLEEHYVLLLIQDGVGGAGLAVAFFVAEIGSLFHVDELAGLRIELGVEILARGEGNGSLLLARLPLPNRARGDIHAAELLNAVFRAIGDPHLGAVQAAVSWPGRLARNST